MTYTKDQLISLRNISHQNSGYVSVLKRNGIFRIEGPRGTRGGIQTRSKVHKISIASSQNGNGSVHSHKNSVGSRREINRSNLIQISCSSFNDSGRKLSQFCHLNAQSVKNKTHVIKDYLIEKDVQLCAITETWLKPQNDLEIAEITPPGFKLDPLHRPHNKAGGIAVIHNLKLKAKVSEKGHFASYDYMDIYVPLGSDSIRLLVIYHPPYNYLSNPVPDSTFLSEFATHMEKVVPSPGYLVVTGDFNIHVNLLDLPYESLSDSKKEYRRTAEKFMDILDAMGLQQLIDQAILWIC